MLGFRRGDISLGIEFVPERKKPCLILQDQNRKTKLASFVGADEARDFIDAFAYCLGYEITDRINKSFDDIYNGDVRE